MALDSNLLEIAAKNKKPKRETKTQKGPKFRSSRTVTNADTATKGVSHQTKEESRIFFI